MDNTNKPTNSDFRFKFSDFTFAANADDKGARQFKGVAYSGLPINNSGYWENVIFDLSSTDNTIQKLPMLLEHDRSKRVGFTSKITMGKDIVIEGQMLGNDIAQAIMDDSDAGFPWQLSVHIQPGSVDIVGKEPTTVNGHEFSNGHVFRDNKIREISFTPTGADDNTSATIFNYNNEGHSMANKPDEGAIETLTTENNELKLSVSTLTAEVTALKDAMTSMKASARTEGIKTLFSTLGREYTEDAAKAYIGLDDVTFSAIAKDLIDSKPKAPDHMFSEQATDEANEGAAKFSLSNLMKEQAGVKA